MFDLETRKKNTKTIIKFTKNLLYKYNKNHPVNGFIVLLIHWIVCIIPILVILVGEVNIYFYISCLACFIIFAAHFYFKGCIFTRIERELWDDKTWYGPWIFPFIMLKKNGINVTSNLSNNIFICFGISFSIFAFLKVLYKIE